MKEILENIHTYYLMWFNRDKINERAYNLGKEKKGFTEFDSVEFADKSTRQYRNLHVESFFSVLFWVAIGAISGAWIECYLAPPDHFVKFIRVSALLLAGITVLAVLPFRETPLWSESYQGKISTKIMRYFYILSLFLISISCFL